MKSRLTAFIFSAAVVLLCFIPCSMQTEAPVSADETKATALRDSSECAAQCHTLTLPPKQVTVKKKRRRSLPLMQGPQAVSNWFRSRQADASEG